MSKFFGAIALALLFMPGIVPFAVAHPGLHGTQRIAPNNQTVPLDVGIIPEIPDSELVILKVRVVDADTGAPLPHRVRITDQRDRYYPPLGHTDLVALEGHVDNASLEPDVVNSDNRTWANIQDGVFTVRLRALEGYTIHLAHGFEYTRPTFQIDLANKLGQTVERTFKLKQGIDMGALGWMSADSHIHSLSPVGAINQMAIEDVDYTNLMFIGPQHPLYLRGLVTGEPNPISTKDRIVYVSQEVRDMNQGHMTLMGMRYPIEPVLVYTGTGRREPEERPNEPLNSEVTERMHAQGGLAFTAHFLFWPGHGSAVGGAIDLLDGLEWTSTDIVNNGRLTMQRLAVPGYEQKPTGADSGQLYYHMLNCGVRLPLIGGTDKMSAARPVGSVSRTYANVGKDWSHEGMMDAIRQGATFVSNGPLLRFRANGQRVGSDLAFKGEGPFTVKIEGECFSQRPLDYIQVVHNGQVVYEMKPGGDQKSMAFAHTLTVKESGWVAVRTGQNKVNPIEWWNRTMAAHTSPTYITVNGEAPANDASATYLMARIDSTVKWAETEAIWSTSQTKETAMESFRKARHFYEEALK